MNRFLIVILLVALKVSANSTEHTRWVSPYHPDHIAYSRDSHTVKANKYEYRAIKLYEAEQYFLKHIKNSPNNFRGRQGIKKYNLKSYLKQTNARIDKEIDGFKLNDYAPYSILKGSTGFISSPYGVGSGIVLELFGNLNVPPEKVFKSGSQAVRLMNIRELLKTRPDSSPYKSIVAEEHLKTFGWDVKVDTQEFDFVKAEQESWKNSNAVDRLKQEIQRMEANGAKTDVIIDYLVNELKVTQHELNHYLEEQEQEQDLAERQRKSRNALVGHKLKFQFTSHLISSFNMGKRERLVFNAAVDLGNRYFDIKAQILNETLSPENAALAYANLYILGIKTFTAAFSSQQASAQDVIMQMLRQLQKTLNQHRKDMAFRLGQIDKQLNLIRNDIAKVNMNIDQKHMLLDRKLNSLAAQIMRENANSLRLQEDIYTDQASECIAWLTLTSDKKEIDNCANRLYHAAMPPINDLQPIPNNLDNLSIDINRFIKFTGIYLQYITDKYSSLKLNYETFKKFQDAKEVLKHRYHRFQLTFKDEKPTINSDILLALATDYQNALTENIYSSRFSNSKDKLNALKLISESVTNHDRLHGFKVNEELDQPLSSGAVSRLNSTNYMYVSLCPKNEYISISGHNHQTEGRDSYFGRSYVINDTKYNKLLSAINNNKQLMTVNYPKILRQLPNSILWYTVLNADMEANIVTLSMDFCIYEFSVFDYVGIGENYHSLKFKISLKSRVKREYKNRVQESLRTEFIEIGTNTFEDFAFIHRDDNEIDVLETFWGNSNRIKSFEELIGYDYSNQQKAINRENINYKELLFSSHEERRSLAYNVNPAKEYFSSNQFNLNKESVDKIVKKLDDYKSDRLESSVINRVLEEEHLQVAMNKANVTHELLAEQLKRITQYGNDELIDLYNFFENNSMLNDFSNIAEAFIKNEHLGETKYEDKKTYVGSYTPLEKAFVEASKSLSDKINKLSEVKVKLSTPVNLRAIEHALDARATYLCLFNDKNFMRELERGNVDFETLSPCGV